MPRLSLGSGSLVCTPILQDVTPQLEELTRRSDPAFGKLICETFASATQQSSTASELTLSLLLAKSLFAHPDVAVGAFGLVNTVLRTAFQV